MDFDWNNPPFEFDQTVTVRDVEESFEDPFAIRLLPDSGGYSAKSRYFNLGQAASGLGVFSVFGTNGKIYKVIQSRPFSPEEQFFYDRHKEKSLAG